MKRFIFDLDGTLLTSDYNSAREYFKKVIGDENGTFMNGIATYLDNYERTYSKYEVNNLCRYLNYVTGFKFTPEIIEGWKELVGNISFKVEDGVVDLLEYLKSKGHSLVVLTNWFEEPQKRKLERAGLLGYFDDIYAGDMVLKPHKEAYICAKDRFNAKDCVVIGDNLKKDYDVPRELGMNAIFYDKIDLQGRTIIKVKRMKEIIGKF